MDLKATEEMYADFAQRYNKLTKALKSLSESVKSKDRRIDDLEKRLESLERNTEKHLVEHNSLNLLLKNNEREVKSLRDNYSGFNDNISSIDDKVKNLKKKVTDVEIVTKSQISTSNTGVQSISDMRLKITEQIDHLKIRIDVLDKEYTNVNELLNIKKKMTLKCQKS